MDEVNIRLGRHIPRENKVLTNLLRNAIKAFFGNGKVYLLLEKYDQILVGK